MCFLPSREVEGILEQSKLKSPLNINMNTPVLSCAFPPDSYLL